jgi:hypothetical protein
LLLALDVYFRHGTKPLGPKHPEVVALSDILNALLANEMIPRYSAPSNVLHASSLEMILVLFAAVVNSYVYG